MGNRGVQAAWRNADPIQKGFTSGILELYNSNRDSRRDFP